MIKRKQPQWQSLVWIGLAGTSAIVAETLLPFSPATDTWWLLLWVVAFYGAMALWIRRNEEALEQAPPALDCVGRPIIDDGALAFSAEPGSQHSPRGGSSRALNQSEAF
jgi:hypothetical protein